MIEYFNTLTVKVLREIAKQAGIKGYSRMIKADLVQILAMLVNADHFTAIEMDAVINEAYADKAEDCGMTLPVIDSEEKDSTTIDSFLSEIHAAIKPLAERAQRYQNEAIENDNPETEEWVQIAKDLDKALCNTEWMVNFRNPSHIYS